MIELIKDNDMPLEQKDIDVMRENPEILGMDTAKIDEMERLIQDGETVLAVSKEERGKRQNGKIIVDGDRVGGIIVRKDMGTINFVTTCCDPFHRWEVSIYIFPEFRKKGYSKEATKKFIEENDDLALIARVLLSNPLHDKIVKSLLENGFVFQARVENEEHPCDEYVRN